MNVIPFKWGKLSARQKKVMTWWCHKSPYANYDGIIADGAIRSGKTVSMGFSFAIWAMTTFNHEHFAICGKTVSSLRRNVIETLTKQLRARGYFVQQRRSENSIIISKGDVVNTFYLFGGKDESSQDLIQGVTLAGVLLDEVALMPESFVNQATARCSVAGSKWWFNCNPAGPFHWFRQKWILQHKKKKIVYLHFTMDDNLFLSERIKQRYRNQYSGVFYQRYILGLWVAAEGLVYDMFSYSRHILRKFVHTEGDYYVSSDFGTQNPTVFLLWRKEFNSERWICLKEYYYSGRDSMKQKTVSEYADDLEDMLDGIRPRYVIVDPSASPLIIELKKRGLRVKQATNDVQDGISDVATLLHRNMLAFHSDCKYTISEFGEYFWDKKASDRGEDKPVKEKDHAMDAIRYFVRTMKLVKRMNRNAV